MEQAITSLFEDLRSGDAFVRFSVLPRMVGLTWTPTVMNAVLAHLREEDDPRVREPMEILVARHQGKDRALQGRALVQKIEDLLENPERDDLILVLLLQEVSLAEAPLVSMALRAASWPDLPSAALPFVLGYFRKFGSFEDFVTLEDLCRHPDPRVLSAAIETLEKLHPESLKGLIIPLLINSVPAIRGRAVRLLYRWDPQEALQHFEALLFSEDRREREAALANAVFLPFPSIREIVLRFLALEVEADTLRQAGALFSANPSLELPDRLVELRQTCSGEKRAILQEILQALIEALHQARLTPMPPGEFLQTLEASWQTRQGTQLLGQLAAMAESGDPELRRTAAQGLMRLQAQNPGAVDLLTRMREREGDPEVRALIGPGKTAGKAAGPGREQAGSLPPMPAAGAGFLALSPPDRLEFLAGVDASGWKELVPQLPDLLGKAPPAEKRAVAMAAARVGGKPDADKLRPLLTDPDVAVVVATIEAIGTLNPDLLLPQFPQLVRHAADEVRAAALRVLVRYDKRQALSLVETMMFAAQHRQRSLAILSAAQFDFPTVRDLLLKALEIEKEEENLRQLGAILQAHAEEPLLIMVLHRARSRRDHLPAFWTRLTREMAGAIARPGETPEQLLARLEKQIEEEQARPKPAPPPYSVPAIQDLRKRQPSKAPPVSSPGRGSRPPGDRSPSTGAGDAELPPWAPWAGGALILIVLGGWLLLGGSSEGPDAPRRPAEVTAPVREAPRPTGPEVVVEGVITFIDPSGQGILVKADRPEVARYYIQVRAGKVRQTYEKGTRFSGKVRVIGQERQTYSAELVP